MYTRLLLPCCLLAHPPADCCWAGMLQALHLKHHAQPPFVKLDTLATGQTQHAVVIQHCRHTRHIRSQENAPAQLLASRPVTVQLQSSTDGLFSARCITWQLHPKWLQIVKQVLHYTCMIWQLHPKWLTIKKQASTLPEHCSKLVLQGEPWFGFCAGHKLSAATFPAQTFGLFQALHANQLSRSAHSLTVVSSALFPPTPTGVHVFHPHCIDRPIKYNPVHVVRLICHCCPDQA